MKLTFLGANHEVTGSCTLLEAAGQRFLIDCGMEQGKDVYENQPIPVAPGEIDGVHYFFISDDKFKEMAEKNEFLEYMHVFNLHYYGTPRSFVEEEIAMGHDVLLEIDVQGAMRVREAYPGAVLVFIAPPSMGKLKSRLVGRGTETPEVIERRFQTAFSELEYMKNYDYIVVNDVLDVAISHMEHIVDAEKCRSERNEELVNKLLGGNN